MEPEPKPEPPRKRQRRRRGDSCSPIRPRPPKRPLSSPSSLSDPLISVPLREIFGTRIPPEGDRIQDILSPDNQNQERGDSNENVVDERCPAQENQGFGAAMNEFLVNLLNPVEENKIILGFSTTVGINVLNMINAFASQFAGVAIVATDHAMNFLYRHGISHNLYTDEDSLSYSLNCGFDLYVQLCSWATHICVFANASTCSKLAVGNFDDLLTTVVSDFVGKVHIVPVMTQRQRMCIPMQMRMTELVAQGFGVYNFPQQLYPLSDTATLVNWVLWNNAEI